MLISVTVTASTPEAAWELCARQMLEPYRHHRWSNDTATLRWLVYRLRHGDPLAGVAIVAGSNVMPWRQPQGSDRWFTPQKIDVRPE